MSPNRKARLEKYRIVGKMITDRDYQTGQEIQGEWRGMPSVLPGKDRAIPYGPLLRVMQLDRGVKVR